MMKSMKRICKFGLLGLVIIVAAFMFIWKPAEQEIVELSGLVAYRSVDYLLEDATLIATGRIAGQSEPFEILNSNGVDKSIFTDYYFTIDSALKGEPYAETITVRMEGGTVIHHSYPILNQRDQYLLFLYNEKCGGWYNTTGNYYYIDGLAQGAYRMDEEGAFVNVESGEELPAQALISPQLDEPVNEEHFREEMEETFRHNYETGMDSWEEYQYNLAQLDQYAAILP